MKRFVHHNPIHGLEHLPFDAAVREANRLLGGKGYLSNGEYRQLYNEGRIAEESVARALRRLGPAAGGKPGITVGAGRIEPSDVWRAHLLFGFEPLDPMLLPWTLGAGGALERLPDDLPAESRRRILQNAEYLGDLWESVLQAAGPEYDPGPESPPMADLPTQRTVGDWLDALVGTAIIDQINAQMTKWVPAFVDEGMAGWKMPSRERGLYQAWRDLASRDLSGRFLGIKHFAGKVRNLPLSPEDAITVSLQRLGVPEDRWAEYLSRHLAQLPGWAGLIRWLGENLDYPGQAGHPVGPAEYLAIRLFYEVELVDAVCRRKWRIPGTLPALVTYWQGRSEEYRRLIAPDAAEANHDGSSICRRAWPMFRLAQYFGWMPDEVRELSSRDFQTLLGWVDSFPGDRHGPVWLEAYEDTYRQSLLTLIAARRSTPTVTRNRPRAQVVFCIDVRSESFRRHVEAQGPYDTFGYAGFFGVAMNHQTFDSDERFPLCPVLLKPRHAVDETVRPEQLRQLQSYASGTRWRRLGDHLFHDLKQNPLASMMLVDVLGFFFSAGLVGKTFLPGVYESIKRTMRGWFHHPVATRVSVSKPGNRENGLDRLGFTIAEQASLVEGGLRTIGLTKSFGRFIVLCGHGSVSDNNPYFGALHCGACGGKHGDANARAFAAMANHPEVRRLLRNNGLEIPDDTWFLAAKHITTSDRVELYDVEDTPATHRDDLRAMTKALEMAGAAQALERCGRMPGAQTLRSPAKAYRHVATRTVDWTNVRPEWGLSSNAAFIIGRRSLTQALNLRGRTFLHSYDSGQDPEGTILERIMTAPLIVGQWINMEHYFSAVDPWFWGSGSKVIHNVVSGVGVIAGSQGDLQTGLPLQTVNNGAVHYHEPMRLLTVIEAPFIRISAIIQKHDLLQRLFRNQWLNLIAVEPATFEFRRYNPDGTWETVTVMTSAGSLVDSTP
jgi:hypothetical protein